MRGKKRLAILGFSRDPQIFRAAVVILNEKIIPAPPLRFQNTYRLIFYFFLAVPEEPYLPYIRFFLTRQTISVFFSRPRVVVGIRSTRSAPVATRVESPLRSSAVCPLAAVRAGAVVGAAGCRYRDIALIFFFSRCRCRRPISPSFRATPAANNFFSLELFGAAPHRSAARGDPAAYFAPTAAGLLFHPVSVPLVAAL